MDVKIARHRAFEQETLPHIDSLYGFAIRLRGNAEDADDLVQETYLKAYRFWDSYDQGTNVRAWLFRILKNSFINLYRKKSPEPYMVEFCETIKPVSQHQGAADTTNLQDLLSHNLLEDDVSSAVSNLPEEFRTVVILSDIEGFTYEEIARFVHCPLGTVRSRLHRARKLLRSALHEYAGERGYENADERSVEDRRVAAGL
jgi:RNA polymerase sigma-70 factor (ECF subfamily)